MNLIVVTVTMFSAAFAADLPAPTTPLHPPIVLRDRAGQLVIQSREPISTARTCGVCHDTDFIQRHSYHASLGIDERADVGSLKGQRPWDYSPGGIGRWNPLTYRYLTPPGQRELDMGVADWIRVQGWRHIGGGPALRGFGETPLDQRDSANALQGVHPDLQTQNPQDGKPRSWDWRKSGVVEMNCFVCHLDRPDNAARVAQLQAGQFGWANTATLANTGLVRQQGVVWEYRPDAFRPDGSVEATQLPLGKPTSAHCGQCHGLTHTSREPLELELTLRQWSTATKGQVFSAQRISESAVNLHQKERVTRPWDVHAQAMLECRHCHFSINNPANFEASPRSRPTHLKFEPRRLSLSEYLRQPSHQFAKGQTAQGTIAEHLAGTMRRCEDCHDAPKTHDWLPYQSVHFERLSCEACHIAQTYAPAVQQVDWTLIDKQGQPPTQWRGMKDDAAGQSLITGFEPILLPRAGLDGRARLYPFNLVSAWYWVAGEEQPLPVRESDLQRAFLREGEYRPELLAALDTDGDGQLGTAELRLDSPEKVATAAGLLTEVGLQQPRIVAELQPYELHHGVGPGRDAIRSCEDCHAESSRLSQPLPLATYLPGGLLPQPVGDTDVVFSGSMKGEELAAISWQPNLRDADLYVLGHSHWSWVNALGILSILGALVGSVTHAALRIRHGRWRLDQHRQQEN